MLRCVLVTAASAAALLAAAPAAAQTPRTFPATALRGEILVTQPPEIRLNGQPARLAPGARLFDERNQQQLSGALVGRKLVVHYTRDAMGQPLNVWVLTPEELARRPWPTTEAQARAWFFDPAAQHWTPR